MKSFFLVKRGMHGMPRFFSMVAAGLQVESFDCFIRRFWFNTPLHKCMTCFEGLLFYDFGAGAQAVLLADAVLIPGLIRISWDEKACCPLNFYECRPLLCRDVFNQMGCILHFFDCLNFNDHIIHWERLGKSDSFMGQVMFVFSSLFIPADLAHT